MSGAVPQYALVEVPPELAAAMSGAAPGDDPERLAEAGFALLERVLGGRGERADALPLLAADALLTQAFEQLGRSDPGRLAEAAARWGAAGRLGSLAGKEGAGG
jgi:hypothetical protein